MNRKCQLLIFMLSGLFLVGPIYADHKQSNVNLTVGELSPLARRG